MLQRKKQALGQDPVVLKAPDLFLELLHLLSPKEMPLSSLTPSYTRLPLCCALAIFALAGCSKDQATPAEPAVVEFTQAQETQADAGGEPAKKKTPEQLYPALAAAPPLDLKKVSAAGYGLYHGTATAFASDSNASLALKRALGLRHVIYHAQTFDELAVELGEYTYHPVPSSIPNQRGPEVFANQATEGALRARVLDLKKELQAATMAAGAQPPETESLVVDLWRINRSWYVQWNGLFNPETQSKTALIYGLADDQMVSGVLKSIEETARELKPKYLVIGDEMERLYAQEGGNGIAKQEWSALIAFFQDAIKRIKDASPDTKVGVGINWDRFANQVALEYAKDAGLGTTMTPEVLDQAFRAIVLPLIEAGGILTLRSSSPPGDAPKAYYQFLRRLPDLYGVNPPVVWYSLSSPIQSLSGDPTQANVVASFLSWNAGVNVEAVYWARLANVDGANGTGDMILGRCKTLSEDTGKDFLLPKSECFDGLFDSLFSIKPAFGKFETAIKGE